MARSLLHDLLRGLSASLAIENRLEIGGIKTTRAKPDWELREAVKENRRLDRHVWHVLVMGCTGNALDYALDQHAKGKRVIVVTAGHVPAYPIKEDVRLRVIRANAIEEMGAFEHKGRALFILSLWYHLDIKCLAVKVFTNTANMYGFKASEFVSSATKERRMIRRILEATRND